MRNLEDIEMDLAAAREALSSVEGTPAEVYSRIVGYYRSVRNWNRGKREEYGERRLYRIRNDQCAAAPSLPLNTETTFADTVFDPEPLFEPHNLVSDSEHDMRLLLFVRASCPGCVPAQAAAHQLGIPVDLVNADTSEGKAEAFRRRVLSTPVAILLSPGGEELKRATDPETISRLPASVTAKYPADFAMAV